MYLFSYSAQPSIEVHCSSKANIYIYIFYLTFLSFPLKYSLSLSLPSLFFLSLFSSDSSLNPVSSFSISSLSFLSSFRMIDDGVGRWVSWMAWLALAWVSGSAMAGPVRRWSGFDGEFCASWSCFFSLNQAQMVGLMVDWGASSTLLVWKSSSDLLDFWQWLCIVLAC